jgi:hypothetical protein
VVDSALDAVNSFVVVWTFVVVQADVVKATATAAVARSFFMMSDPNFTFLFDCKKLTSPASGFLKNLYLKIAGSFT